MKLGDLLPRFAPVKQETRTHSQQTTLWQRWIQVLAGNQEPQIFHRRDRQGHSYLEVYDPTSGKTHQFDTTKEVRIWLEQRYYHS
jgi:hypothetical protein